MQAYNLKENIVRKMSPIKGCQTKYPRMNLPPAGSEKHEQREGQTSPNILQ